MKPKLCYSSRHVLHTDTTKFISSGRLLLPSALYINLTFDCDTVCATAETIYSSIKCFSPIKARGFVTLNHLFQHKSACFHLQNQSRNRTFLSSVKHLEKVKVSSLTPPLLFPPFSPLCSPTHASQEHPGVQPHAQQPERALGARLGPGSAVPGRLLLPDWSQAFGVGE